MDKETLIALEEALAASPNNHILRKQVAKGYLDIGEFDLAKDHLNELIMRDGSFENKLLLAQCFKSLENNSAGILLCEELIEDQITDELASTYVQLLLNDGQQDEALSQYQNFLVELPGWEDPDLEMQLKVPNSEFEIEENSSVFLEKPNIKFDDVGGMQGIKDEIDIKIVQPQKNPDLFKAFGKKAGGGILMYGPPGCGKTYLSRATAGEIDSKFISVGIDEVVDMWIGNSEKNLHEKFEIARRNQPCVLFFDEIDALGSKRNDLRQSAGRNMINQFLKELDGIDNDNEGLLILGATNSPWHMDSAFLRPGRFDRIIFVPPPDMEARIKIIELLISEKPTEKIDSEKIASKTKEFSGADLSVLIDHAVEEKLRKSMKSGKIELLTTKDILKMIKKVRPSTKDWFNTARNYALYSNSSGIYDDIKDYLDL